MSDDSSFESTNNPHREPQGGGGRVYLPEEPPRGSRYLQTRAQQSKGELN